MSTLEKHSAPAKPFDLMAVDANGNMTRITIGDLINAIAIAASEREAAFDAGGGDFKAVTVNADGVISLFGMDEIASQLMPGT